MLRALSYLLPPNIIAFQLTRGRGSLAKCAVFRPAHFRRALGRYAPDHFLKGRVTQRIALVWSRSASDEAAVTTALQGAREGTARWVRPYLPRPFSVEEFAETMLAVSYAAEIRPERPDRVSEVFNAQREALVGTAETSLRAAVASGMAREEDGVYCWAAPPGRGARIRMGAYFALSKVRATVRWAKYVFTFDEWLNYLLKKVERRGGLKVELRESERRWPLILLWPKVFRVLRSVRRGGPDGESRRDSDGKEHSP
jgi:flavin-binding protein dodecin